MVLWLLISTVEQTKVEPFDGGYFKIGANLKIIITASFILRNIKLAHLFGNSCFDGNYIQQDPNCFPTFKWPNSR